MNDRTTVEILTSLLILAMLSPLHEPFKLGQNSGRVLQTNHQPFQNVSFTLLAVEQQSNGVSLKSAQHLIKTLRLFNNWQNGSTSEEFQYFNHIHLLSNIPFHDIDPECQAFYKGNVTRAHIMNETSTFFNQPLSTNNYTLSIRILYYIGETSKSVVNGTTSYYLALDQPVYDLELNEILENGGNSSHTLIILDASYSGGYLSTLKRPGRVILTACDPTETANRWMSSQGSETECEGWFTGHESASFENGTNFGPLGIVGGILNATDINKDGWRSANEIFQFASKTTTWYAAGQKNPKTQMSYRQHPWSSYGIAGGEIPVVQTDGSTRFPGKAKDCAPRQVISTSSQYDFSEFEHRMYRQSLDRRGFAPTKGPEEPQVLWLSSLNDTVTTSPALAEGMVFVGASDGKFYALDMTTGEILWMFEANTSISSSPAVVDGIVFLVTEEPGKVYALDSYTGLLRWVYEVPTGAAVTSSPAICDDMVFIGSSDRYLRSLSQFEGELLWTTYIGGEKLSSPAIADAMIFITSPYVYAVDMLTGKLVWRYVTEWAIISSPAVADGLVFVGSQNDDKVFALEQDTGNLVWSFRSGGWFTSPAVDTIRELVITGCRDARIYCLDEQRGFPRWEFVNGVNYLSAPTISANGLVYVGSSNGNLYCIEEETGEEIWKYSVGAPIVSSPSVIYEHVYVGSLDGKIYCFGPPFPTHDIAILCANVSDLKLRAGELLEINCTIKNYGSVKENVVISFGKNTSSLWTAPQYVESMTIHSENVTVESEAIFTFMYSWDISNETPGLYSITVQAHLVPDETDASDNMYLLNKVMIVSPSDLDANGEVDVIDIAIAARAYGSTPEKPNWNENADINKDGIINIIDIASIAKDFGEIYI